MLKPKKRSVNNRTITISDEEKRAYSKHIYFPKPNAPLNLNAIENKTICADLFTIIDKLPPNIADLVILDPPYNLNKDFHGMKFKSLDNCTYLAYLRSWFSKAVKLLKTNGSLYLCGDWRCAAAFSQIMEEHLCARNRITWQREKGRGASRNWKNSMEDIWFGVASKQDYYFDVSSVKMKRKVIAPYKKEGKPKDWEQTQDGNFRITYPSNFWDDISVPYWSMPENTDHPTQKPEKLIAKLILASSPENGLVFDPFLGSGTTSVVAKKLKRRYVGVEINETYCAWAEKRLSLTQPNDPIQGYTNGVFWERNMLKLQGPIRKNQL